MKTNAEKFAYASKCLDSMVRDCPPAVMLEPDAYALMAVALHQDDDPRWVDVCMWMLAIAQARLASVVEGQ